jgi:hypothetical protein
VFTVLVFGGFVLSAILITQQRLFFSNVVVWFLVLYEDGGLVFWSFDCWVFFGIVFVVVGFLGVGVGGIWGRGNRFGLLVVVVVVECRGRE